MASIEALDAGSLPYLVNKTYKLYRCSPLFGFGGFDPRRRRRTEASLRRYLAIHMNLHNSDEPDPPAQAFGRSQVRGELTKVEIQTMTIPEWPLVRPQWKPLDISITIQLKGKPTPNTHNVLMFPAITPGKAQLPDEFACYPLVLMKTTHGVGEFVGTWLCKCFDSYLGPLHISNKTFETLVEAWTHGLYDSLETADLVEATIPSRPYNYQSLELTYSVPNLEEITAISVSIRKEELMKIVGIIRANRMTTMQAIHHYVFRNTRLNISSLVLTRIGTPVAYLSTDGKLKVN
ncbi:uncharacterized protein BYT42DRAFT_221349 [Radiomyces spectabilis]|uniref:uncharacterized protein n=1 Tax=Radiomyces spectabilis TaxID=64574 RepID=UPI00221E880D|nr:uncharacterized protein BYT42DRAFT_221349 [Radiomyces spectabilis]KAI8388089.1 hypothetical protein BYT42DRAFT_221349 [Radiomyces spectabilis]